MSAQLVTIVKLQKLFRKCGHWAAARWAAKRGIDFEITYIAIFGKQPRF